MSSEKHKNIARKKKLMKTSGMIYPPLEFVLPPAAIVTSPGEEEIHFSSAGLSASKPCSGFWQIWAEWEKVLWCEQRELPHLSPGCWAYKGFLRRVKATVSTENGPA